ncbi:Uncharacterized protein TCM_017881 [Theobroma cacao]|uniref:Uncharacterized protein n=1 Tax=Theobroma cacao TaxID=3641 RepID=A0A061ELQ5_THECC|nr:Uncharacterized protein TCM_017881 [Theobroma cacao]
MGDIGCPAMCTMWWDAHELGEMGCPAMCTMWWDAHELSEMGCPTMCTMWWDAHELGGEHSSKSKETVLEDQETEYLEFDSQTTVADSVGIALGQGEVRKTNVKPCEVSIDIPGNECLSRCRDGCDGLNGSSGSLEGALVACAMSKRDDSPDALHSTSEGSLDSTAKRQWLPNPERLESSESLESEDSSDIQEAIRNFLLKRSEEWHREKMKEAITKGNIHPRKVSTVRHFPPGCGISVEPVSSEECRRIQRAWIEDKMRKYQEVEGDSSMCTDQGEMGCPAMCTMWWDAHELGEMGCPAMCTMWWDAHELGEIGCLALCTMWWDAHELGAQCKSRTGGYMGPYFIRNLPVLMMYKWIGNQCLVTYRFEGVPVARAMCRRDGSPDAPHGATEGSLDSTAMSQWCPDLEDNGRKLEIKRFLKDLIERIRTLEGKTIIFYKAWSKLPLKALTLLFVPHGQPSHVVKLSIRVRRLYPKTRIRSTSILNIPWQTRLDASDQGEVCKLILSLARFWLALRATNVYRDIEAIVTGSKGAPGHDRGWLKARTVALIPLVIPTCSALMPSIEITPSDATSQVGALI